MCSSHLKDLGEILHYYRYLQSCLPQATDARPRLIKSLRRWQEQDKNCLHEAMPSGASTQSCDWIVSKAISSSLPSLAF